MKTLLFASLLFLQPLISFSQKQANFEHAMRKFKGCYNGDKPECICKLFSDQWDKRLKPLWTEEDIKYCKDKLGDIRSYKFMGMSPEDSVMLFKTVFTKTTRATGLTLDKKNKLMTFRLATSSSYIDSLLSKN